MLGNNFRPEMSFGRSRLAIFLDPVALERLSGRSRKLAVQTSALLIRDDDDFVMGPAKPCRKVGAADQQRIAGCCGRPPQTPYFCESSGLSNCALPCAALRRRKLGLAASSASDIARSSSFAEIRELILREE